MQGTTAPPAAPDMTFPRPHGVLAAERQRGTTVCCGKPVDEPTMPCTCTPGEITDAEVAAGQFMAPVALFVMPTLQEARAMTAAVSINLGAAQDVAFGDLGVAALRQIADYERDQYKHAVSARRRQVHYRRWHAARLVLNHKGMDA